jgi:hypothetical protein
MKKEEEVVLVHGIELSTVRAPLNTFFSDVKNDGIAKLIQFPISPGDQVKN